MKEAYGVYVKDVGNHQYPSLLGRNILPMYWITVRHLCMTIPPAGLMLAGIIRVKDGKPELEILSETHPHFWALQAFFRAFEEADKEAKRTGFPTLNCFEPFSSDSETPTGPKIYFHSFLEDDAAKVAFNLGVRAKDRGQGHWSWSRLGYHQEEIERAARAQG